MEKRSRRTGFCYVCGNDKLTKFFVREMLIGRREVFEYGQCKRCGALTRLSQVDDISLYYPSNYSPFTLPQKRYRSAILMNYLKDVRDRTLLTGGMNPIGRFLGWIKSQTTLLYRIIGLCKPNLFSRILDVGCGAGYLLHRMSEVGFQYLVGIDPFIPEKATLKKKNIEIIKGDLTSVEGRNFDLIMMHHCFEHCDDQRSELRSVKRLLAKDGLLLLRQPLCDSEAFKIYKANWFQIDAPRHVVLHSVNSMKLIVNECGLKIKSIVWDSSDMQFWASEQYKHNIPMYDEKSYFYNPDRSIFTSQQIIEWKNEAKKLNEAAVGDQAAFYIES